MTICDPLRCPNGANCPALALGRAFGDLFAPAILENPKGCSGVSPQPLRMTVSAGVEWLRPTPV